MTREKETTIYFANGREANIYRYKPNEYSIQFNDTGTIEYGSYLQIMKIIRDYETKIKNTDKQNDEENHPMVSVGTYINLWTTGGDYDVFIIIHEAEPLEHFDKIIDNNIEDRCQDIMQNKYLSADEKKQIIKTIMNAYTDFGVQVIMKERK